MISANNSSRLLLDCKYEHRERYDEILNYLFGEGGLDISHLKVEIKYKNAKKDIDILSELCII
ncbi:MAG: hypothetical protein IJ784_08620 [Ruminiclostridium sp.]|nr:hypothetical protein [Ruminiclostridium sp.]